MPDDWLLSNDSVEWPAPTGAIKIAWSLNLDHGYMRIEGRYTRDDGIQFGLFAPVERRCDVNIICQRIYDAIEVAANTWLKRAADA